MDADRFRAFEIAGWDAVAEGYHAFLGPVTRRLVDPLLDAAAVVAGARVLDIASGPGYVAGRAAARGARVVAADAATGPLELAARLHAGLAVACLDAERLPFAPGVFDAVVCGFGIGHFPRPALAAAEIAGVLRPGGRMAISWWDVPERSAFPGIFHHAIAESGALRPPDVPDGPPMLRFGSDDELATLMTAAGLAGARVDRIGFPYRVADAGTLWDGALAGTVRLRATILGQTAAMQQRIREAFDRRMAAYARAGGGFDIPISVKIASARRARG
jgi:SAM-dependent methyltransferase